MARGLTSAVALTLLVAAGTASAQQAPRREGPAQSSAQFTRRRDEGGGGASAEGSVSASTSSTGKRASADRNYDEYLAQEKAADAAETSPLRYGTGWIIGPYLTVPKKFFSLSSGGSPSDLTGYSAGA